MLGEVATATGLVAMAWGGYRAFVASKLKMHVVRDEATGGANLVIRNTGADPAYIGAISVRLPRDAKLSALIEQQAQGPYIPWLPPPTGGYLMLESMPVDISIPPDGEASYGFFFWSRSSRSASRIEVSIRETWLRAWRRSRTIPIPHNAVVVFQNSGGNL